MLAKLQKIMLGSVENSASNKYLKVRELRLLTYWTTKVNRSSLVGLVLNPSVCIILEEETPTLSQIMFI